MNTESLLNYATLHSQSMIQWIFLVILALVGVLIAQSLLGGGRTSKGAGPANVSSHPEPAHVVQSEHATAVVATSATPVDSAAIERLRGELSARETELAALRAQASVPAGPSGPDPELSARLKQLEAKLAEYEILEDDIADLSLFKEENSRLKAELEALRGTPPAAEAPAAVEPPPPRELADLEPTPPAAVTRTAEAAAEAALAASAFDEPATPKAALSEGADDLFAEFADALDLNPAADEAPKTAVGES